MIKEVRYQRGVLDGTWRSFYPNGQIEVEGTWRADEPTGKWTYYRPDGTIEREVDR